MISPFRSLEYVGLAKDTALWNLTRNKRKKEFRQQQLSRRMAKMHGLPQKIGQIFSLSSDPSNASEFVELQEQAEAIPLQQVKEVLQEQGVKLRMQLDDNARAASLGQVHQARTDDGRRLAVKVRYPGIEQAVDSDLNHLDLMAKPFGNLKQGFNYDGYQETIRQQIDQELDYRIEAGHQDLFFEAWKNEHAVVVPRLQGEQRFEKVLISTWEDGAHHQEVLSSWSDNEKAELSRLLLEFFLKGIFEHGLMQADWHPGNFRFRKQDDGISLVLYDFGCVCQLSRNEKSALAKLILSARSGSDAVYSHLVDLGFDEKLLQPIASKIQPLTRILFEPFLHREAFDLKNWQLGSRVNQLLADDRWNFRFAGPPRLLTLVRAFHGLTYYLDSWGQNLNWSDCFDQVINESMIDLDSTAASSASMPVESARYLKIRIHENGLTKVKLSLPADTLERLDEVVDDNLRAKIERNEINLSEIVDNARRSGYVAQPIFDVQEDDRTIQVWLE